MFSRLKSTGWSLFPFKGFIVRLVLSLFYALPERIVRHVCIAIAQLSVKSSSKKRRIIETNLDIAFTDLSHREKQDLVQENIRHNGLLLAEFPLAWLGTQQQIEAKIALVEGQQHLDQWVKAQTPVIVVMPHIGNWEFLVQWIQINYPMIGFYKPSKLPQVDQLVYRARSRFGGQPFAATNKGVLGLMRQLRQGNVMVILPDQVPQLGAGAFTPFFNKPAYTMTLLHKLRQKTNAQLVFAKINRRQDDLFEIFLSEPSFDINEKKVAIFNQGLNHQIETMIASQPAQYVWDYKRFKRQPDNCDIYAKPGAH